MNYILTRKDNPKEKHNLNLDEFLEFIGKHPIELYALTESEGKAGEKTAKITGLKNNQENLDLYKKTLTFAQINDIQLGNKKIEFNNEIGYYLRTSKARTEAHFSQSQVPVVETELEKCKKNIGLCNLNEPKKLIALCYTLISLLNAANSGTNSIIHENHGGC